MLFGPRGPSTSYPIPNVLIVAVVAIAMVLSVSGIGFAAWALVRSFNVKQLQEETFIENTYVEIVANGSIAFCDIPTDGDFIYYDQGCLASTPLNGSINALIAAVDSLEVDFGDLDGRVTTIENVDLPLLDNRLTDVEDNVIPALDSRIDDIEDIQLPSLDGRLTQIETVELPAIETRLTDVEDVQIPALENRTTDLEQRVTDIEDNQIPDIEDRLTVIETLDIPSLVNATIEFDERLDVVEGVQIPALDARVTDIEDVQIPSLDSRTTNLEDVVIPALDARVGDLENRTTNLEDVVIPLLDERVSSLENRTTNLEDVVIPDLDARLDQIETVDIPALEARIDDIEFNQIPALDNRTTDLEGRVTDIETVDLPLIDSRLDDIETNLIPDLDARVTDIESIALPLVDGRLDDLEAQNTSNGVRFNDIESDVLDLQTRVSTLEALFFELNQTNSLDIEWMYQQYGQTDEVTAFLQARYPTIVRLYYNNLEVAANIAGLFMANPAPILYAIDITLISKSTRPVDQPAFLVFDTGGGVMGPVDMPILIPPNGQTRTYTMMFTTAVATRTIQTGTYTDLWDRTTTIVVASPTVMTTATATTGMFINLTPHTNTLTSSLESYDVYTGLNIFTDMGLSNWLVDIRIRGRTL